MARRQPEGQIKDACRKLAERHNLLFWQIEGKQRNGVPDTLAGRVRGGCMLIEFKQPGKEPTEQQWLRIHELRQAGQDAWWTDSVEGYRLLVGLDPDGYEMRYPKKIEKLIGMKVTVEDL